MSKRFFPQQVGDRKKAKLDVTISDHNFPLSQNAGPSKESNHADTWGDDNDDEILLLASQACEDAYNDISSLPDYSLCMQPTTTSTQMFDPGPSTSKTPFAFKKPSSIPPNVISTSLKDKCNRISSPLPGISSKMMHDSNGNINLTDDLIFNDKICKGQGSDQVYRQLLQLQEENAKLKSENGKLLEKCVTKEGESSILRTQLKTCQVAVDNARLERIKAQEKVQMEWSSKLTTANSQMHDLKTQLDFKNLEIISIKEKCRMLESNKVKLTQVTVPAHDISSSHRNNSFAAPSEPARRARAAAASVSVQTERRAHALALHAGRRADRLKLPAILPLILEPAADQHSLLEYNEKLQQHTDVSQNKCRVYSMFRRWAVRGGATSAPQVSLAGVQRELGEIAAGGGADESYYNIVKATKTALAEVAGQLELVSRQLTTAFQREMDERYIGASEGFLVVGYEDLLRGRCLYKEEQAIVARRMTAMLSCLLQNPAALDLCLNLEEHIKIPTEATGGQLIDLIHRICKLLDSTSCAQLYSGLLLSLTKLLAHFVKTPKPKRIATITETLKYIVTSRPMPFVSCQLTSLLRVLSVSDTFLASFCVGSNVGNLKMDYDQGVLLYKKDSCALQILLKQVEATLSSIEKQNLIEAAAAAARDLIAIHTNVSDGLSHEETRCECQLVLIQVLVYALRICASMSANSKSTDTTFEPHTQLLPLCRSGTQLLYQYSLRTELRAQLQHHEGQLQQYCQLLSTCTQPGSWGNMLSELSSIFQQSPEDMKSFDTQAWQRSFETFSLAD